MTSTEGARKLLRIARKESPEEQDKELEERPVPELLEALAGQEMDEEEEFRTLDTIAPSAPSTTTRYGTISLPWKR